MGGARLHPANQAGCLSRPSSSWHTLVECDEAHPGGPATIDLWKLALDGSGRKERLTHFADFTGHKSSNGVESDDGRFMVFQMGHAADAPGIGHGVFLLDLKAPPTAPSSRRP